MAVLAKRPTVAATALHTQASEILGRVSFGDEEIVITKSGKPVAAIVPLHVLAMLQRLEDREDVADARAARAEAGRGEKVSHAAVKARLGL